MRDQRCGVTAILIRTLALYHVNCHVKSLPPRHGNTCRTFHGYRRAAFDLTYAGETRSRSRLVNQLLQPPPASCARARARVRFSIYILISRFGREGSMGRVIISVDFRGMHGAPINLNERANLTSIKRTWLLIYSRRPRRRRTRLQNYY